MWFNAKIDDILHHYNKQDFFLHGILAGTSDTDPLWVHTKIPNLEISIFAY